MNNQFAIDVEKGFSVPHKFISSKYLYDKVGDELFMKIMNLPEYYLTNKEMEILRHHGDTIKNDLKLNDEPLDIYELGVGDGIKTIELLRNFEGCNITFHPIDISKNAIEIVNNKLKNELPWLNVKSHVGDYKNIIDSFSNKNKKLILFLGSNLGNYSDDQANDLIRKLASILNSGDKLLLGLDLIKDPVIIKNAYNDESGVTKAFNLNILRRMNKELNANFNLENFDHHPVYNEYKGVAYSYILSKIDQEVLIKDLNKLVKFKKGELIHTEISRKYNCVILKEILMGTYMVIRKKYTDKFQYFADFLIEKV